MAQCTGPAGRLLGGAFFGKSQGMSQFKCWKILKLKICGIRQKFLTICPFANNRVPLNFWLLKFYGPPSPLSGEEKSFNLHTFNPNFSLLATFYRPTMAFTEMLTLFRSCMYSSWGPSLTWSTSPSAAVPSMLKNFLFLSLLLKYCMSFYPSQSAPGCGGFLYTPPTPFLNKSFNSKTCFLLH